MRAPIVAGVDFARRRRRRLVGALTVAVPDPSADVVFGGRPGPRLATTAVTFGLVPLPFGRPGPRLTDSSATAGFGLFLLPFGRPRRRGAADPAPAFVPAVDFPRLGMVVSPSNPDAARGTDSMRAART